MLNRQLKLNLPKEKSLFLWGARKTGKSTYLKKCFPNSFYIDLLHHSTFLRYSKSAGILKEEIEAHNDLSTPIIIDEVQKVPEILDEVHFLIENNKNISFILCGSSLRRLKHTGSNLLGGRAWRQLFLPLCYPELPKFDLLKIFNHGLLPEHYLSDSIPVRNLEGYIVDYIIPEVQWEGQIRNLGAFTRFLEAIAFSNGEILNYSNIARECHVNLKTVQGYIDLMCDMLLGYIIRPYTPKTSRQLITSSPKFYFFDTSIPLYLLQKEINILKGADAGHALEHYIFLELKAYQELNKKRYDISYWRTKSGMEVDFIIGKGDAAIEVKISSSVHKKELNSIIEFTKEYNPKHSIVVSLEENKRVIKFDDQKIIIYPVEEFLSDLWNGLLF
ncbi:MAG: AAA family ATPase [Rickettsia endosymbiont of Graphium doson]|nr:AAA family ATPase [Rickettsia endosymbiont of Graphium doson]